MIYKRDLIDMIVDKVPSEISRQDVKLIVDMFIEELGDAIGDGYEVYINNLGKFYFREFKGAKRYNVSKKEYEYRETSMIPKFKFSKRIKELVRSK